MCIRDSLNILDQCLKELIGREEVVETVQRDRVLYTRIMCVESDEVGNTHITQFLEHQCTVKRFSLGTAVLTSFIKEWHDHVDTMSLITFMTSSVFSASFRERILYNAIFACGSISSSSVLSLIHI